MSPQLMRIGPNTSGIVYQEDGNWWPIRMEMAGASFFSRTLLPEEWYFVAMTPPAPIGEQALPLAQLTLPPLTLPTDATFMWALTPPSWFGDEVTMYIGASEPGAFGGGTNVSAEVGDLYPDTRKMVWAKPARGTAGANGCIQWVWLKMPLTSGCVNYASWVTGDTAHFSTAARPNFTICVPSLEYLQSFVVVQLNLTKPPVPATRYPYIPMSESPPTGLAQCRTATKDNINFKTPAGQLSHPRRAALALYNPRRAASATIAAVLFVCVFVFFFFLFSFLAVAD